MFLIRILLFPIAVLYDGVTRLRNLLFDLGLKPSASFSVPTICIGNLAVGGTGKTPMAEYVLRLLLANRYEVATLSRGYGRRTKGMRLATDTDSAETLGDEPFQLYQKFKKLAIISVGEERAMAIPFLVDQFPALQAVVLDDAFQHRPVKPGFSILLTRYDNLFYNDWLLPTGRLREARNGATRAQLIVVTKCAPTIRQEEMTRIEKAICQYADVPVFFSSIRYGNPVCFAEHEPPKPKRVVLVTGLANAKPMEVFVQNEFTLLAHKEFSDHFSYSRNHVDALLLLARQHDAAILTTEKDRTKLDVLLNEEERSLFFYVPIETMFIKGGPDFDAHLLKYISEALASASVME
jgi:tetraacyldisaccharide 4'-kinase